MFKIGDKITIKSSAIETHCTPIFYALYVNQGFAEVQMVGDDYLYADVSNGEIRTGTFFNFCFCVPVQ